MQNELVIEKTTYGIEPTYWNGIGHESSYVEVQYFNPASESIRLISLGYR